MRLIERRLRITLVMRLDFKCGGTVIVKRIARWSDRVGSVEETDERIVEVDRVIRRSSV